MLQEVDDGTSRASAIVMSIHSDPVGLRRSVSVVNIVTLRGSASESCTRSSSQISVRFSLSRLGGLNLSTGIEFGVTSNAGCIWLKTLAMEGRVLVLFRAFGGGGRKAWA